VHTKKYNETDSHKEYLQTAPSQSTADDVCLREIFLHTFVPVQSAITKLTRHSKRFNANIKICTMTYNNVRQLIKTVFFKSRQEESAASTLKIHQPDCALYY